MGYIPTKDIKKNTEEWKRNWEEEKEEGGGDGWKFLEEQNFTQ